MKQSISETRLNRIRSQLEQTFAPVELEIADESHLHAGHAGAKSGKGHYSVKIISAAFEDKRPLERHRMVFEALGEMMYTDIHALKVYARPPQKNLQSKTRESL